MGDSGMEMMLSAMASPIEDDLLWSFSNEESRIKDEVLDSAAQSPSSSLFEDFDDSSSSSLSSPTFQCDSGTSSLSSFDMIMNMFPEENSVVLPDTTSMEKEKMTAVPVRKNVVVRRRTRECSMVCWLFRTLLTSEYRALPINAIYEIFEETLQNKNNGHGRHYRQSIRHCLMTSAVFVRVLTPNPRKDFLVMNEQGSWWTVHPDCEMACVEHVFRTGSAHRCPPTASIPAYYSRVRSDESRMTGHMRGYVSSTANSECSSSSSSAASSPTNNGAGCSSSLRRFDPIRRVGYPKMVGTPTYRKVSTGLAQSAIPKQVTEHPQHPPLLNPRSILLNDIAVDHEEVIHS